MKHENELIGAIIFFGLLAAGAASKMQGKGGGGAIQASPARPPFARPPARPAPDPEPPYRRSTADRDPQAPSPNPEAPFDEGYQEEDT